MSSQGINDLVPFWEWNPFMDLVIWLIVLLIGVGIWTWTHSGRERRDDPDILARNVEDFAGTVQEANGSIPRFLILLYITVAIAIISYQVVTLIFGYDY